VLLIASLTSFVGDHGVYAVFGLMIVAAVLPVGSELVMIYAGAVASGAFPSQHVILFGHQVDSHFWAYVTVALAGAIGNTIGCALGWALGFYAGRPLLEGHGKWLHVTPARVERAERWFDRFGPFAVPLGLATPIVRSFVAIPAGFAHMDFRRFVPLAFLGCSIFCFGLAAGGWALGASYNSLHHDFTWVSVAIVAAAVVLIGYLVARKRSSTLGRGADDSAR
jgi:membrane protein DedA with SNARE-associated domain